MGSVERQPVDETPDDPTSLRIRENLAAVHARIAAAAQAAGRDADEITLVAVTKYVGVVEAAALLAGGCSELGESRPQELWDKAAAESLRDARWHLVGHLQRNKVDRTAPLVDLIHSVDSLRLLKAIDKAASRLDAPAQLLLEVNTSGDQAKHGFTPEEVLPLGEQIAACTHVVVTGLMTMAAREGGETVARSNFAALRELRDRLQGQWPENAPLGQLSMGMSGDFPAAIAEGATLVRIGSALFEGVRT